MGTKQVGKSNLKKTLTDFVIKQHQETKTIIIDPEGSWEFSFSKIRFYRVPKKTMKISEEPMGQRLNGQVFTRKVYRLDKEIKSDVLKLLKDKKPILFVVELDDPEEVGYFSAFVIEQVYDMQRIKRKYWKGNLKQSYFIVLEEAENIFDQSSLDKTIFNKLRKKYAEMANLKIGILSSSQRLTEVSKKFRAKMAGYLIGHILPEDFIGILQRALRLHLGKDAKKVTNPEFRYSFHYTGTNTTFKLTRFEQEGKPYEIPRTEPDPEPEPVEPERQPKPKRKPSLAQRFFHWLLKPRQIIPRNRNQPTNEEDLSPEHTLLAENEEQETKSLFW